MQAGRTGERTKSMKAIKKTENVIEEKAKKEEAEQRQDVIIIDPENDYGLLAFGVADFLAERTAERFEVVTDDMKLETVVQIVRRIECSTHKEAVKMLQVLFLANGCFAEAEDLDLLWMCAEQDEKAFDYFYDSLTDTGVFEKMDITILFDEAGEHVLIPFRNC